ncbi:TMhelix containing protein [Vibrio phage 1.244.A._10N.261.54.C3]|nr:TMhelix containing protein [Vibrio phage 1.244.A._10N.261.54.C3]AUR98788.1 TMhelix containing protein [Vibrio phage 1.255.O._10N.286.45.F1]
MKFDDIHVEFTIHPQVIVDGLKYGLDAIAPIIMILAVLYVALWLSVRYYNKRLARFETEMADSFVGRNIKRGLRGVGWSHHCGEDRRYKGSWFWRTWHCGDDTIEIGVDHDSGECVCHVTLGDIVTTYDCKTARSKSDFSWIEDQIGANF